MGKPRVGIVSAWITAVAVIIAAIISILGKGGSSPGQKMDKSPGATQVVGDQNNYYSMPEQELRPYLSIELKPGPNEYLRKDGNSQLFLICCHNNFYLVLPFKIRNIGKIHAVSINAEYSSPDQNYTFDLGEKSQFLASGDEIPETIRPHINIMSIVNNDDRKDFKIEVVVTYQRYDKNDSRVYNSKLELTVAKDEISGYPRAYKIKEKRFTFDES